MIYIFQQLKIAIAQTYCNRFSDCNTPLQDWKGKEIRRFQQDLSDRAQGQISEKSFYTYFKSDDIDKLPRLDILNLLSLYVGFSDWEAFAAQYSQEQNQQIEKQCEVIATTQSIALSPAINKQPKYFYIAFAIILILFLAIWATRKEAITEKEKINCTFCFVDTDTKTAIRNKPITLQLLKTDESPQLIYVDTLTACTQIMGEVGEKINFIVSTPYYHADTISRTLQYNLSREIIALRLDDYALMLHYISKSDLKDWQQRRKQLNELLADELQVVQIYANEEEGIAIYNKAEFIDKLTMPIGTLKNIEIIQTNYNRKGQAIYIRFK